MQQALPWIIALAVLVVVATGMAFWVTRPRQAASIPLPTEWPLGPRPVFSVDERRAYRQLRDAFPQYIVLSKLPLVRFCQPSDANDLRYWFELLGGTHVSFAVCSAHGRVLIAIDLDAEQPPTRRSQQIKQSVLSACRIRYLRCSIDHLPSMSELQMLLPQNPAAAPSPAPTAAPAVQPTPAMPAPGTAAPRAATMPAAPRQAPARAPAAPEVPPQVVRDVKPAEPKKRKDRKALWQDSGLFQDSFFGIDNLRDAGPSTGFGSLLGDSPRGPGVDASGNTLLESARQGPANRR
jgi:Protein of unknown function (DUF2726)